MPTQHTAQVGVPADVLVDVRGPRFAAWVTAAVLVATLILSGWSRSVAAGLMGVQAAVFAIGALGGPRRHPYGWLFAHLVKPRLAPAREWEPVAPLRFAQLVGLLFAAVGVLGFAVAPTVGIAAAALALTAAFLNAAFGICLGCQLYPLAARLRRIPSRMPEPA